MEEIGNEGATTGARKAEEGGADGKPGKAFMEELGVLDDEQAAMMAENCILVNCWDLPIRSVSKVRID